MAFRPVNQKLVQLLNEHKDDLKYEEYPMNHPKDKVYVSGIGFKSIKAIINDGEEKWYFHNQVEGRIIGEAIIKSFDNELWNEEIRSRIATQEKLCRDLGNPMFAPNDGFCFSCGEQIYTRKDGSDYITGCPHCGRSFCD